MDNMDTYVPPYVREEQERQKLREYRRQVREHIQGNLPFHEDEWSAKKEEPVAQQEEKEEEDAHFPLYNTMV